MTFPLERISRGHCILHMHSARSPPCAHIGGLPDENPDTANCWQIFVPCHNAYSNPLRVRLCALCTPLAITRDPEARPRPCSLPRRPHAHSDASQRCGCRLSVALRQERSRRTGRLGSLKPPRFRHPMGVPLTRPAQLRPGAPPGSFDVRRLRSIRFVFNLALTANRQ